MTWLAFVAGAVLSWGVYGAMLHQGQVRLGSPMRALLCVGVAYFLVGVVVPVITLFAQGQGLRGFNSRRDDGGDRRRHARRARRGVHHLLVPHRRHADLRDAAGVRRRSARQRALHDGDAPAEDRAEPDALPRASSSPPSARGWCCTSSRGVARRTSPRRHCVSRALSLSPTGGRVVRMKICPSETAGELRQ